MIIESDISFDVLKESYQFMAHIVTEYGDVYFPIFEKLHQELERSKKRQCLLKTAFKVSVDNSN